MDNRCMRCMYGTLVNGVCNHCGHPKQTDRKADALPLSSVLAGKYIIGDVLGAGGFGITYAAWDTRNNRRVALKELYPTDYLVRQQNRHTASVITGHEGSFSRICESFRTEAQLLMQLRGMEGVVQVFDLFNDNNTVYYAMEFLDGQDLRHYLQTTGQCPTWDVLGPAMRTILSALGRLHQSNLIHRDISPDNIFLTRRGEARLIDFGSTRTYMGNHRFTTVMKRDFAPIEQHKDDGQQGPWTDVYSLAVTMYYTLSGKLPPSAMDRVAGHEVTPLYQLVPTVPRYVSDALEKAMAVHWEDRYQTTEQFAAALYPARGGGSAARSLGYRGQNPAPGGSGYHLVCTQGIHRGRQWNLVRGQVLRFGRRPECEINYPVNTPGVSGYQCSLMLDDQNRVLLRDDHSSYGTSLVGTALQAEMWYKADRGYWFTFAQEQFIIQ